MRPYFGESFFFWVSILTYNAEDDYILLQKWLGVLICCIFTVRRELNSFEVYLLFYVHNIKFIWIKRVRLELIELDLDEDKSL